MVVMLITMIGCNKNILYDSVYRDINSTEKAFYGKMYDGVKRTSNSDECSKIIDTYKRIFHKLTARGSKYFIDTSNEFYIVWNNGGPNYCIWGMIWNKDKIIRFDRCLYGKSKKLEIRLIDYQRIEEISHTYMIFDLVNRWDTGTINKLNWKSITEFYADTTLISYTDSLNKARNYNLPLETTDPPAYTAAKVDIRTSEIKTIIFRLP
ncbi:MAG: hypothetical protein K0B11_21495 [Mariniphaga sp.]|nr:hypothetical protein [Mariniphaga sp.]